jgi:hypothetical protein
MEHFLFEFLLNYVRRIKLDSDWRKLLKTNPEKPFLLFVTPSDIAFILSLIKNGMEMWDQARRLQDNPTREEIKALPVKILDQLNVLRRNKVEPRSITLNWEIL